MQPAGVRSRSGIVELFRAVASRILNFARPVPQIAELSAPKSIVKIFRDSKSEINMLYFSIWKKKTPVRCFKKYNF
jgi:hypothetical protein